MRSSERIRKNVGHFLFAVLCLILGWVAFHLFRDGEWGAAAFACVAGAALVWHAWASGFAPDWESETVPPTSAMRTLVAAGFWLCLGAMVALPELLLPGEMSVGEDLWQRAAVFALFGSPALALLHLQFRSGASERDTKRLRWGIERLGPIGAFAYFVLGPR